VHVTTCIPRSLDGRWYCFVNHSRTSLCFRCLSTLMLQPQSDASLCCSWSTAGRLAISSTPVSAATTVPSPMAPTVLNCLLRTVLSQWQHLCTAASTTIAKLGRTGVSWRIGRSSAVVHTRRCSGCVLFPRQILAAALDS
jgi:hypothetical protein